MSNFFFFADPLVDGKLSCRFLILPFPPLRVLVEDSAVLLSLAVGIVLTLKKG
jgi:hypothetical protein